MELNNDLKSANSATTNSDIPKAMDITSNESVSIVTPVAISPRSTNSLLTEALEQRNSTIKDNQTDAPSLTQTVTTASTAATTSSWGGFMSMLKRSFVQTNTPVTGRCRKVHKWVGATLHTCAHPLIHPTPEQDSKEKEKDKTTSIQPSETTPITAVTTPQQPQIHDAIFMFEVRSWIPNNRNDLAYRKI
jgi:hypothetical protein